MWNGAYQNTFTRDKFMQKRKLPCVLFANREPCLLCVCVLRVYFIPLALSHSGRVSERDRGGESRIR